MATLEDYQNAWTKDAKIDASELDTAARNVPLLHAKWWKHYSTERLIYRKLELDFKTLYRQKWEWYLGKMDDTDRAALGWPVQPLKILSQNVSIYIDGDKDVQALKLRLAYKEEVLKFLEDVLKSINTRGFAIKNTIDFLKFKNGVI